MKKIMFIASAETCGGISCDLFFKDLCLIPVLMKKKYDFESGFVSYNINEEQFNRYFEGIRCDDISKTGNYLADINAYLKENAVNIDIAFLFGPYKSYDLITKLYKLYNPQGKIYLKLDMNRYWLKKIINEKYFKNLLEICDLVTVEDRILQNTINCTFNCEVEYLRNGCYEFFKTSQVRYEEKKNIILNVGRIGAAQKRTEVLTAAFLKADLHNWELRLVGSIDKKFENDLKMLNKIPRFKERVKVIRRIEDKKALYDEYRKAKIFCMTSASEGCAHVYPEAGYNGCYIVSTDVDGISDLAPYDSVVPVDDFNALARVFEDISENEELMKENCYKIQEYIRNEGTWDIIISKLYLLFCIKGLV